MACDVDAILEDSTCVDCIIPRGLQPAVLLVLLCAIADGDTSMSCNPQAIIDAAVCLQCKIPDGMMFPALIVKACEIAANGGGGGGGGSTQVFCGHYAGGTPTDVPTTACALAYDLDAPFALWHYEEGVWA